MLNYTRQVVQIDSYESTGLNRKSTDLHMHMHMHRQPLSGQPSCQPFLPASPSQPSYQPFFISRSSSPKVVQHVSRVIQQGKVRAPFGMVPFVSAGEFLWAVGADAAIF
jgi:hypothetical protein